MGRTDGIIPRLTAPEEVRASDLWEDFNTCCPDQGLPWVVDTEEKAEFLIMAGWESVMLMRRAWMYDLPFAECQE